MIQLNRKNDAVALAKGLLSLDYPDGLIVPEDFHRGAASVRFRRLDIDRCIDPVIGGVTAGGVNFGPDVRVSNVRSEVMFAHKTGLTYNFASDAGIVESSPERPWRRYIIVFIGNRGHRFADEPFALRTQGPSADAVGPICYTQRIPSSGRAIDEAVTELSR